MIVESGSKSWSLRKKHERCTPLGSGFQQPRSDKSVVCFLPLDIAYISFLSLQASLNGLRACSVPGTIIVSDSANWQDSSYFSTMIEAAGILALIGCDHSMGLLPGWIRTQMTREWFLRTS